MMRRRSEHSQEWLLKAVLWAAMWHQFSETISISEAEDTLALCQLIRLPPVLSSESVVAREARLQRQAFCPSNDLTQPVKQSLVPRASVGIFLIPLPLQHKSFESKYLYL